MAKPTREPCPCGKGKSIETCCGRWHGGEAAPDAETLMRSRYTAFVLAREPYLLSTWHPSTRPQSLNLAEEPRPRWLGLTVKDFQEQDASHATVHFVARYKVGGRAHRLEETSRFVKEEGRWFYVDGDIAE